MVRKLTHQEILERQARKKESPRVPLTVVLNNIRSLYNVGSIFRTADGAGIEKIWLCGITGCPPQPGIVKTALGAEQQVPWEYCADALSLIREFKKKAYQIVFLEQTQESIPFQQFQPEGPVCLVLGNEITGISEEFLDLCDQAIEIEMSGAKNSLNVSVAFGIVAYHLRNAFKPALTLQVEK